ncbi:MAG: hypothetical protein HRU09_02030 [Oligoflexales bacterium]|nr:hypothetical protein [Oligoflexales bacterium]
MISLSKNSKASIFLIFLISSSLGFLASCGSDDDDDDTATATVLAFSDVSSIIETSCGTSSCHGSGAPYTNYVGSESLVNSNAATIKTRIEATDSTVMPPTTASADQALSAADKTTLLNYLNQQ